MSYSTTHVYDVRAEDVRLYSSETGTYTLRVGPVSFVAPTLAQLEALARMIDSVVGAHIQAIDHEPGR